jgi:hypothetical protein
MSIDYYVGSDGPTINVVSAEELYEALDLLHTQVIDNLPDTAQAALLRILEDAMGRVQASIDFDRAVPQSAR